MSDVLVPIYANGRLRLASVAGDSGQDLAAREEEQARRSAALKRRQFYDGEQYDYDNEQARKACGLTDTWQRLPEHERLHAYATQIAESVDFISDQLAEGFRIEADADEVTEVINAMIVNTEAIRSGDTGPVITCDDVLSDALLVGDYPYEVRYDPVNDSVFLEFWASEQVTFHMATATRVRKVSREETIWVADPTYGDGNARQALERVDYEVAVNNAGFLECRRQVFWDQEEEPRSTSWLGFPMLPWHLLRGSKRNVRAFRGESIVRDQAMDAATRYDANEQTSYLIARYNSHGNLAVVGDGASIQIEREEGVRKDVADVLRFPGGSTVIPIALPTDPQMIEHQRKVLSDSIYQLFGLVRVEPETLQGLGGVTGYALEILNRKTEGTFRRIRRQWSKDWGTLVNLVLDVTAYRREAVPAVLLPNGQIVEVKPDDVLDVVPEGSVYLTRFWEVDPQTVFPNRDVKIQMGSGYIVDDVAVRDDYTADLISRQEALRQRGRTPDEIEQIVEERQEEKATEGTTTTTGGAPPATSTGAGSTVGGTTQRQ